MRSFDLDLRKSSKALVEGLAQREDNDIHPLLHHRSLHCFLGLAWDNNRLILAESVLDAPAVTGSFGSKTATVIMCFMCHIPR